MFAFWHLLRYTVLYMEEGREEEQVSLDSFGVSEVSDFCNEQFDIDSLNQWTTGLGLIQSAIALVEKALPQACIRIFCHESEIHEYREIDREGVLSLPDDSIFIGCLSMVGDTISVTDMFSEFQIDDPLMLEIVQTVYRGRYLVPVVHVGELLAFLLVCSKEGEPDVTLTDKNVSFLDEVAKRLQINLYAAFIAGMRQRELLTMAQYPLMLQRHRTLESVYSSLLKDLSKQLEFDKGVCYAFEMETGLLVPFNVRGLRSKPPALRVGQGISGQVFESGRPLFVPDRATHTAYSIMKEEKFISGSFISVPLGSGKERIGVITLIRNPENSDSFSVEHRYRLEIAAAFISSEVKNRQLFVKLDESNFNVVQSLTRALEAKDAYTEGHSARVTKYSVAMARRLGYPPERIHQLRYGAMLHDIGKIGISDVIINKTSRLTDEEFTEIKSHAEIGYKILDHNSFFSDVKDYVRYHHEAMDGSGYYGKKEGEYPEEAMIISCADIFDALTSDRPYRKALPFEVAFTEMRKSVGVHFPQHIFDALVDCIRAGEADDASPDDMD